MKSLLASAAGAVFLTTLAFAVPQPAAASSSFACVKAGGGKTQIDACGARWAAADVRAHLAAQAFGGSSASCLARTADALDALATKWEALGKETPYALPCGALPAVASADDGVLAAACPNAVWTYANHGKTACSGDVSVLRHALAARSHGVPAASAGSGPNYDATASWLAQNLPAIGRGPLNELGDGAALQTTGFAITNCVVTWQFHLTSGQDGGDWTQVIPFSRVAAVAADPDHPGVEVRTAGNDIHQTVPIAKDFGQYWYPITSSDDERQAVAALTRLAQLCRTRRS